MAIQFDLEASNAVFSLPDITGGFDIAFADYLGMLGARRPSVVLAFPPKAAGTFLRVAAVLAVDGQFMRTVHAQGGRDGTPYLPTFVLYYAGGFPASTLVTHLHAQALPANRSFFEAFDLKPVIMIRDVADMLVSYWDMLEADQSPDNWLNFQLPRNFPVMPDDEKADFLIDMAAPWYASYYASWFDYARTAPDRVCILDYCDFRRDSARTLETLLRHSRLERSYDHCRKVVETVWGERDQHRFNKGVEGRGRRRFKPQHLAKLERMLFQHYGLEEYRDAILPARIPCPA